MTPRVPPAIDTPAITQGSPLTNRAAHRAAAARPGRSLACSAAALLTLAPVGAALAQASGSAVLDGDAMLLRTLLALVFVVALILGAAWLARRFGLMSRATGELPLRVVASCALGTRERVVVLEVEQTWLVLGVTAHNITSLHTMPATPLPASANVSTSPAARALEKLWRRAPSPPAPGTGPG